MNQWRLINISILFFTGFFYIGVAYGELTLCSSKINATMNFGSIVDKEKRKNQSITLLEVICDPSVTAYKVIFTSGYSPSYRLRYMQSGQSKMFYNLFLDPGHHLVLGDGTGGTNVIKGAGPCTSSFSCKHKIYGYIYNNELLSGEYHDKVEVIVIPEVLSMNNNVN